MNMEFFKKEILIVCQYFYIQYVSLSTLCKMLEDLSEKYDYIIIGALPIVQVTDL